MNGSAVIRDGLIHGAGLPATTDRASRTLPRIVVRPAFYEEAEGRLYDYELIVSMALHADIESYAEQVWRAAYAIDKATPVSIAYDYNVESEGGSPQRLDTATLTVGYGRRPGRPE